MSNTHTKALLAIECLARCLRESQPNRQPKASTQTADLESILFTLTDAWTTVGSASALLQASTSEVDRALALTAMNRGIDALRVGLDQLEDAAANCKRYGIRQGDAS